MEEKRSNFTTKWGFKSVEEGEQMIPISIDYSPPCPLPPCPADPLGQQLLLHILHNMTVFSRKLETSLEQNNLVFGTEQFSPKNLPRSFVRAEPLIRLIEFARKLEKSLEQNNLVLRTLT